MASGLASVLTPARDTPVIVATEASKIRFISMGEVLQLFVGTGASRWNDPMNHPWAMGIVPSHHTEGTIYAEHILKNKPSARVAVLFRNDDFGQDDLKGVLDGLGDKARTMVVIPQSDEVTDPTVDSQLVTLKASGADTFFNITTPKFAAQAIRKLPEIGWKPVHDLASVSGAVSSTLKPAGLDNSVGIIRCTYLRDPADPEQVASLDVALAMQDPGANLKTSADDFVPVERMRPQRFNGTRWEPFGAVLGR